MPDDSASPTKGQIPTTLRLMRLLEEVARAGTPVAPATLAEALGLPKPTVHRLLTTAEDEGFLQRDVDGRSYGPGQRLRWLAGATLSSKRMRAERLLIMRALSEKVGETINLAAAGRFGMVYLDRVETLWPLRIQLPVGSQVPFHCTASGKMYLAALSPGRLRRFMAAVPLERRTARTLTDVDALVDEIRATRERGYALDREEFMDEMIALAVPIRDQTDRVMSTLSFHAPTQRFDIARALKFLDPLRKAAEDLSRLVTDEGAR